MSGERSLWNSTIQPIRIEHYFSLRRTRLDKKLRLLIIAVVLGLFVGFPIFGNADETQVHAAEPGDVTPENTVILANQTDARFSQDFSLLLRQLRLEWVILEGTVLPESVKDKNLILLGHPDDAVTGEIIRGILTAEEIEMLRTATDRHVVIEKESPWAEGRTVTICSGADMLLTRNAAEEAEISAPGVVKQLDHVFIGPAYEDEPPPPGTPGSEMWTFRVLSQGVSKISFEYSRPWEDGEKAEWTFVLSVVAE